MVSEFFFPVKQKIQGVCGDTDELLETMYDKLKPKITLRNIERKAFTMRAFLSINLTDDLHLAIQEMQQTLNRNARGIRWTSPDNCHLTLKFFGDISETTAETIERELMPIGREFDPFQMEMGQIGQFPPHGPLTVLWVGIKSGQAALMALERSVHQALTNAGIPFDKKPFSPHLTIGRVKRGEKPYLPKSDENDRLTVGTLLVHEFCLMESILQPSGPIYTVRQRFPLNQGNT